MAQREHRRQPRYPFFADVQVVASDERAGFWGSSHDISLGGMFVATTEPVPQDARLTVDVHPDVGPPMRVHARVIHIREGAGFGCIFTRLSQHAGVRLTRWLGRTGGMPPVAGTIRNTVAG